MAQRTETTVGRVTLISLDEIKMANERAGFYFFEPGTMRFFKTRISRDGYLSPHTGLAYFVTSEKGPDEVRRYSVRSCDMETGKVETVGEFQQFRTSREADKHAHWCAGTSRSIEKTKTTGLTTTKPDDA